MNINSDKFKMLIYDLMIGNIELSSYSCKESEKVKNEFTIGSKCAVAYQEIFEANLRICNKLGVQEDEDVECIVSNFFDILQYLSLKMFDYGVLFTNSEDDYNKES